jgi:hypothetical protein
VKYGEGRGYYGVGQLQPDPPKRSGGGWIKLAVVVGVGAFIWYMWPRKDHEAIETPEPKPLPPSETPSSTDLMAQVRGFPSQQAYEDAVVASAKQLRDSGAQVTFAPHLQHLTPRLGTG